MSRERRKRIEELVAYAKEKEVRWIDGLLVKARDTWPYLHEHTLRSYAVAALKIAKVG